MIYFQIENDEYRAELKNNIVRVQQKNGGYYTKQNKHYLICVLPYYFKKYDKISFSRKGW
jgi:hypothetical protein